MASGNAKLQRHNWLGWVVGVALVTAAGISYRVAASQLSRNHDGVHLPRGTLGRLPLSIRDWSGHDEPLDEFIVARTGTDDHVNRTYNRLGSHDRVRLFLAFGVRVRDLMPHRPEVCYRGSGWTLEESRELELTDDEGVKLPFRIQSFTRGGLITERIKVLNYYIIDGQVCRDVSLLRSKAVSLRQGVGYAAQVQIVGVGQLKADAGEKAIRTFALDSAQVIRRLLSEEVAKLKSAP